MKLLNIKEASEFLRISEITLYKYVSKRSVPFIKVGRKVLFNLEDLEKWVENKRVKPISGWVS